MQHILTSVNKERKGVEEREGRKEKRVEHEKHWEMDKEKKREMKRNFLFERLSIFFLIPFSL